MSSLMTAPPRIGAAKPSANKPAAVNANNKRAAGVSTSSSEPVKATGSLDARPLSGLFGINKPSGPTSMSLLEELKYLFAASPLFKNLDGTPVIQEGAASRKSRGGKWKGKGRTQDIPPKIGQGGTLDPLADGVLVIGVGAGTKQLGKFLDCTKEYHTVGLLGSSTTSYDAADPILYRRPHSHISAEVLRGKLPTFRGEIEQMPPLYSAIRVDGMRLFDYARKKLPLPRPIEKRKCTISKLELVDWWNPDQHEWKAPDREVPEEEKALVGRVKELAGEKVEEADAAVQSDASVKKAEEASEAAATAPSSSEDDVKPPAAFALEMVVSSGTYVRSIVHDLAQEAGSAAHVVELTRTRQGEFWIEPKASKSSGGSVERKEEEQDAVHQVGTKCIEWSVFQKAIDEFKAEKLARKKGRPEAQTGQKRPRDDEDEDEMMNARPKVELKEWEKVLLAHITPV